MSKLKVVIGCLNAKYIHMSSAPWCLAAGVRAFARGAYEIDVLEGTVNGDLRAFADKILQQRPDVVSLSCYIWNVTQTLEIARAVKAAGCTVILGGPEVAWRGTEVLQRYPFVDYVLCGEGEFAFPAFLDMLTFGGEPVPGLYLRKNNTVVSIAEQHYTDTPPSPYSDEYFAALGGRICYIESSRGCPYRCAFCLSGRIAPLRFFDMEQTQRDLLRLSNSGTRTVKFVDRTFNADVGHANEILSFILEHYGKEIPRGVCFHFEIAGDILRESTMDILRQMPVGAVQLEIGLQTFNEQTLAAIHRKTNTARLQENIRKLLSFQNMHVHIDLIAGLTVEDMDSFIRSFNTAYELGAHMLQLGFLKLLHGADMREYPEQFPCSFQDTPPYEVTATPWLSRQEISQLKQVETMVDRLYNSGRFLWTLTYLQNALQADPYTLFARLAQHLRQVENSPGAYATTIYRAFGPICEPEKLQEALVCDLLCCGAVKQLRAPLKIMDPRHKAAKRLLAAEGEIKVSILPHSHRIIAVDQRGQRDLHGRLPYSVYDLDILDTLRG